MTPHRGLQLRRRDETTLTGYLSYEMFLFLSSDICLTAAEAMCFYSSVATTSAATKTSLSTVSSIAPDPLRMPAP